jgi:hypothetical protein
LRFLGIILRELELEVSVRIYLNHSEGGMDFYGFLSGCPPLLRCTVNRNLNVEIRKMLYEFEDTHLMSGKETADLKIVETTVAAAASLPSSFT